MFASFVSEGRYEGFTGVSAALLVLAIGALALWGVIFAVRWLATRPKMPDAGPETNELGDEPPAVVNLLVNRWKVTRSAIQATLLDLAARRVLGVEEYAGGNVVVRLRDEHAENLSPYEKQVVDVVRRGVTGGSAPIEALTLGEPAAAEDWWKRFDKAVVKDARARGLARGRWAKDDWVILGGGLFVVIELFALALGAAHLAESASNTKDGFDRWDWLLIGLVAWGIAMVGFGAMRDLRDTQAGRAACARWLGVRSYLRNSHAFSDVGPGAVAIWERYMGYAAATGVAHDAVHALPLGGEDPNEAWTRSTGDWRRLRVEYPEKFGFGQPPWKVFLIGLGQFVFWGALAVVVLRFVLPIIPRVLDALLTEGQTGGNLRFLVIPAIGIPAAWGVYAAAKATAGLIRLVRGGADLGRSVTVEGEVVKVHAGRVAIDSLNDDEVVAWTPPPGAPGIGRGMRIRIERSPRLYFVTKVEVLSGGQAAPQPAATGQRQAVPGFLGGGIPFVPIPAAIIASLAGVAVTDSAKQIGDAGAPAAVALHSYDVEGGGHIKVSRMMMPKSGGGMLFGVMKRVPGAHAADIDGLGDDSAWVRDRVLMTRYGNRMVSIEVDVPGQPPPARQAMAKAIAAHVIAEAPAEPEPVASEDEG